LGEIDCVELRDGRDKNAMLLQHTYHQKPEDFWITSNGQFLWVKFKSNARFTSKGFKMKIKFFKDYKGT